MGFHNILMLEIKECSNTSDAKGRAANEKSARGTMSFTQLANQIVGHRHSLSNFGEGVGGVDFAQLSIMQ